MKGFTLIELLVAMTITLLLAGALAGVAQPARAAFDRVPAELDLQQRGRTAIDAISQALRASVSKASASGVFDELTVVVPVTDAARGLLSADQSDPAAPITLSTEQCPNIKDVCGFKAGSTVMIADSAAHQDVFSIASVNTGARRLTPSAPLSRPYPAGSFTIEVDQFTFALAEQADGSYSLIRETAAGAIQPLVDFVSDLSFDVGAEHVDVRISIEPQTDALRAMMRARTFRTSIKSRNPS
ncbi:MAG: prepilin-type N-terminal cleavage/methylation domain-containing protein [Cyanobacteria bacterium]|nr:prepilin-type N-terminal cleavage/methylation domain-containing protein [Cyanobacteriota bacterium]